MNDLNATTKLEWALQMAESIAVLHYHHRGVIVHGKWPARVGCSREKV